MVEVVVLVVFVVVLVAVIVVAVAVLMAVVWWSSRGQASSRNCRYVGVVSKGGGGGGMGEGRQRMGEEQWERSGGRVREGKRV